MPYDLMLSLILVLSFAFYAVVMISLVVGMSRVTNGPVEVNPLVSVVVAARNEERTVRALLDSLIDQTYRPYEIVLVDDDSSDGTLTIFEEYARSNDIITVVSTKVQQGIFARKKNALTQGILASKGEILCFTDADCVPQRAWIETLVSQFDKNVGLVAGYSPYDPTLLPQSEKIGYFRSIFYSFIHYEEIRGAVWSAAAIGLGIAWLCTGRNLAYRRELWLQVSGFSTIMQAISGDDDLFVQLVRKKTNWKIRYVVDPLSFVPTIPPSSFLDFIQQRKRHFSAGKYFTLSMKIFFFIFHLSNLILFAGLAAAILMIDRFQIGLWLFLLKILVDLVGMIRGTLLLCERQVRLQIIPMEILYLLYNTFIGPLGFLSSFSWKPNLKS